MNKRFENKVTLMKRTYGVFCPCGLGLGIWLLCWPEKFWATLSQDASGGPIVLTIYGAVLCGIGIICLLGYFHPLRYLALFPLMILYKSIFVVTLVPRLIARGDTTTAGWIVIAAFLSVILVSIRVFPWGSWDKVGEALRNE